MTRFILTTAFAAMLVGTAHARDSDRLDPALQGGEVTVCRGILTSSGTCIGSESNVEPDSYEGVTVYRQHDDLDGGEHHLITTTMMTTKTVAAHFRFPDV